MTQIHCIRDGENVLVEAVLTAPEIEPMQHKPRCERCGGRTTVGKPIKTGNPNEYIVERKCQVCKNIMYRTVYDAGRSL